MCSSAQRKANCLLRLIRRNGLRGWRRSRRFVLWVGQVALVRGEATIVDPTGADMRSEGFITRITVNTWESVNISR